MKFDNFSQTNIFENILFVVCMAFNAEPFTDVFVHVHYILRLER